MYLRADIFNVNNGLSQGLINCITQDHFGFIWIGTQDGLNRYDGYKVSVFRHDLDDSNSVSENYITAVFEDSRHRLWVGTEAGGLNLFDCKTERFVHFKHDQNQPNTLSDARILAIKEDGFGAIWVSTKNGLNKIVTKANRAIASGKKADLKSSFPESPEYIIKHIQFDASGKEFFYFHDLTQGQTNFFMPKFFIDFKGLVFVRTENDYFCIHPSRDIADTIVRLDKLQATVADEKAFSTIFSRTHARHNREEFLFVMAMDFLGQINPVTGTVSLLDYTDISIPRLDSSLPVTEQGLWFTIDFHLYQYNRLTQTVVQINSYEANEQLSVSSTAGIYKDKTGIIWVGTTGYGLFKFNTVNEKFHNVRASSMHWFFANTANEVIARQGLDFICLKKNGQEHDFRREQDTVFFKDILRKLNGRYLVAAVQDSSGNVWLHSDGIQKYNLQKKKLEVILTHTLTWAALYIDYQNTLYFVDDGVLCEFVNGSSKAKRFPIQLKIPVADFYVETIFKDSDGIIWLGTLAGLLRFNPATQSWAQYSFRSNDSTSLSSNLILSICPDPDNKYLWLGTNGGGFNLFDKAAGKCRRYTTRDGLPNNVIYGILSDESGNLWMSTNSGISNFNPRTKKFENYTSEDGLQGNEFNRHAYCKSVDGTMFFGGVNGYNYFNPKEINENQAEPQVIITDIKSNEQSIDFREIGAPISMPIYLTKKVVLDFSHNTLSFDFSAMYFKASTHDRYQYMLQGVDKDWVSSATNHSAVYSNLNPGKYVFKVKAGRLNKHYTYVEVVILSPWYMTWWFTMLVILVMAALGYMFYAYSLKQEITRYKDHQRIASDLHDEIGSTLSSIHIYSEVAQGRINTRPLETETFLKQISNSVENMIGSLDDIVWTLKSKNDRFEDIGNRMRSTAVNICEASGYNLELNFDDQLNELKFSKEIRKNLFLVYKEAINNAIKYADGKNLFIGLSSVKNVITLSVKDDGIGLNEERKNNGNGLGNMQKRAKALNGTLEIVSAIGKGTNVILKFKFVTSRQMKTTG